MQRRPGQRGDADGEADPSGHRVTNGDSHADCHPDPDLAAIGQAYEASASAFASADCQAATIINANPTTASWKQAMTILIPALKDASGSIRALGAPPEIQATLDSVAAALDKRETAAEAIVAATTDAELNDAIEQQYNPSVALTGSAADAARTALGLAKRASDTCA